jgi:peptidoglycan/LPS O-acetylase OafA/YrhL
MTSIHHDRSIGDKTSRPTGQASVHLDALRGIAAICVLLNHWKDANLIDYSRLGSDSPMLALAYAVLSLGRQWVIVFFVLSGYLVGGSVLNMFKRGTWSWRTYIFTRLTRLFIVLVPALILGAVWDWIGMQLPWSQALYNGTSGLHELTANVHATLKPQVLLGNLAFLQTIPLPIIRGGAVPIFGSNGPLWSLSNEFWYYVAFPVLVILLWKKRGLASRAACAGGLVVWGWFVGLSITCLWIPWLLGVAVVYLPTTTHQSAWTRRAILAAAILMFIAGLIIAKLYPGTLTDIALGVVVSFLVWVLLRCTSGPLSQLYTRIAQRAARSSYTLYLVHVPLLIFLTAAFHLPRVEPRMHLLLLPLIVLLVILSYAQAVYLLFERNTDTLRRWLKPYILGPGLAHEANAARARLIPK